MLEKAKKTPFSFFGGDSKAEKDVLKHNRVIITKADCSSVCGKCSCWLQATEGWVPGLFRALINIRLFFFLIVQLELLCMWGEKKKTPSYATEHLTFQSGCYYFCDLSVHRDRDMLGWG